MPDLVGRQAKGSPPTLNGFRAAVHEDLSSRDVGVVLAGEPHKCPGDDHGHGGSVRRHRDSPGEGR